LLRAARAAARQFVIGDATAIRSAKRWRETGSFEAKSNKGQSRSPLKKHEEWLLALVRQEPDLTLEEIQRRLLEERQQNGFSCAARRRRRAGRRLPFDFCDRPNGRHRWLPASHRERCLRSIDNQTGTVALRKKQLLKPTSFLYT
jgi:hypothetical protein